jgi:hypothetical protein
MKFKIILNASDNHRGILGFDCEDDLQLGFCETLISQLMGYPIAQSRDGVQLIIMAEAGDTSQIMQDICTTLINDPPAGVANFQVIDGHIDEDEPAAGLLEKRHQFQDKVNAYPESWVLLSNGF